MSVWIEIKHSKSKEVQERFNMLRNDFRKVNEVMPRFEADNPTKN